MKTNMYKGLKPLFVVISLLLLLGSCEKQPSRVEQKGKIGFTVIGDEFNKVLKSATFDDSASVSRLSLLISIADADSNIVIEKKIVPLYMFGNQYISEKIELNEGYYFLTEFMVVNNNGEVVYASPKHGSELAYLVNHPLPLDFKVVPGVESGLNVEVIPVDNQTPDQFGYVSFGVQIVNPLVFYAMVYEDNPLLERPLNLVPARVIVTGPDGYVYRFDFKAGRNKAVLRNTPGEYVFSVKTELYSATLTFTSEQLINATEDKPLMITVGNSNVYHEIILRTTPDSTDDAMITDLNPDENYGDVKELSASFLTEPVLTVMRTKRSLIRLDFHNALPKSATIQKIELMLHLTGGVQMPLNENTDTINIGVLKAIVQDWDEHKVTWLNQPQTTDDVMMYLDYRPWMSSLLRVYDITELIKKSWQINTPVYGFMLQHYPENVPGGITFASSDNDYAEMRPSIKIYYTLP
ncbi:DNRLRE domain-containing protein [Saccharicrinis sp. FJH54]|uniref:DNRLRE domain-containing protein n=1 Tax=Saccharicrinis sp. FJH54 TaxID=3344665 RepID=UPI0035D47531